MNINLTISLDQETKDLLQQLASHFQPKPKAGIEPPMSDWQDGIQTGRGEIRAEIKEKAAGLEKEIAAATLTNTVQHTIESLRAVAHKKKKEDVRALLTEFKAAGLTKLEENQYDEFMIKLNKLS